MYQYNGVRFKKKLYRVDGVYCHKVGDFYQPISPRKLHELKMAELEHGELRKAK